MRLPCPICGERDRREFYYQGVAMARPAPEAAPQLWDDYMHNRKNVAGVVEDLWCHEAGCAAYMVITRNTVTHAVLGSRLFKEPVK